MALIAAELLSVLMRWMHIASMALLVGGAAYMRLIARPALEGLGAEDREVMARRLAFGFRPLIYASMVGILGSGLFNFFARLGHTMLYHAVFGVKMLLAAHIFASAILLARGGSERIIFRRAAGIYISGVAAILIAAYLRRIF